MISRVLGRMAIGSLLLSVLSFAGNCKNVVLYENNYSKGKFEESTRTFPESPEWSANWGDFEEMKHPYIRFSGMKNYRSDWTGHFIFDEFPLQVNGGSLKLKVRSTQSGNFGVWLSGKNGAGKISFHSINDNQTKVLEVPIKDLMNEEFVEIDKVGIGLFGVPANQYLTLFVDDIELNCVQEKQNSNVLEENEKVTQTEENVYVFTDTDASSPVREKFFEDSDVKRITPRYSLTAQSDLRKQTQTDFVVLESMNDLILSLKNANEVSKDSWKNWYKVMFFIQKGRLKENAIANPEIVFAEAKNLAAMNDYTLIPLLLSDVEYDVQYCADTACALFSYEKSELLFAGIPTSYVNGSKVRFVYDPYYVITQKKVLPQVDICLNETCKTLSPKSEMVLEFPSAGIHSIKLKIRSQSSYTEQNLFVEVK